MPGSVMSMASAASAASVGPAPAAWSSRASTSSLKALKRWPSGFLASAGAAFSQRLGDLIEQALLAAQPLQAKGLDALRRCMSAAASSRACVSSAAKAWSSADSSNAVRLGIASFIMRNRSG